MTLSMGLISNNLWFYLIVGTVWASFLGIPMVAMRFIFYPNFIQITSNGIILNYPHIKKWMILWHDMEYMQLFSGERRYRGSKKFGSILFLRYDYWHSPQLTYEAGLRILDCHRRFTGIELPNEHWN
jgi:hypothetical protein